MNPMDRAADSQDPVPLLPEKQRFLEIDNLGDECDVVIPVETWSKSRTTLRTRRAYQVLIGAFSMGLLATGAFAWRWKLVVQPHEHRLAFGQLDAESSPNIAMAIGSFGAGSGGKCKGKSADGEMSRLSTMKDLQDFNTWCDENDWFNWGMLNVRGTHENFLNWIKQFCDDARAHDKRAMLYYTGYGENGTGDWCFHSGDRISLSDVMDACSPLPKYGLEIRSDACFSGKWAYQAKHSGYDVAVESASGPNFCAQDRVYAMARFRDSQDSDDYTKQLTQFGALRFSNGDVHYLDKTDDFSIFVRQNFWEKEGQDKRITAQGFSEDAAFLVMSRMPAWVSQTHHIGTWEDLTRNLKRQWREGYDLTSLRFTRQSHLWSMVTTKGSGIEDQSTHWAKSSGELHSCYDDDKVILDVSYGDPGWMIVCGKTDEITVQKWLSTPVWETMEKFISEARDDGYRITSISKGGDDQRHYLTVMSKVTSFGQQSYIWATADNVKSQIEKFYADGKTITSILDDYLHDKNLRYWVVFTQVSGSKLFPDSSESQSARWNLEL